MDHLLAMFEQFDWTRLQGPSLSALRIVLIVVLAWVSTRLLQKFVRGARMRIATHLVDAEAARRAETVGRVIRYLIALVIGAVAFMLVLAEVGISLAPILGAAGVVGLAIGFGAQSLVKDYNGFFLLFEDQIRTGDVVNVAGIGGLVEDITLRHVRLRDYDGNVHFVPNNLITSVTNMSRTYAQAVMDIGVAYREDIDKVMDVMRDVGAELRADAGFAAKILGDLEIAGVERLDDSAVVLRCRFKVAPLQQWKVRRAYFRRIKAAFDHEEIEIPYPHVTITPASARTALRRKFRSGSNGRRDRRRRPARVPRDPTRIVARRDRIASRPAAGTLDVPSRGSPRMSVLRSPASITRAIAMLLAAVNVSGAANAATAADRIEAYPIETLDLTTAQVLHGGDVLPAPLRRTIAGELRLPRSDATRVPAVVFLHGDAGEIADQAAWIDEINAAGIAVLTVDSFSGRGLVSATPRLGSIDGALPSAATRIVDAYRALALLAAHPRIDPARIALMGVSSGGRTTILAAMKRFSGPLAGTGARFAAYVALYPPCAARLTDDERLEPGPLRIFIGAADNITRADACERFVARLRAAGADAAVTVYAGAYHGFDNPEGSTGADLPDEPSFSACTFVERDDQIVNAETGRPPVSSDRCVTKGLTAGRNAAADAAVRGNVRSFLMKTLGPDP